MHLLFFIQPFEFESIIHGFSDHYLGEILERKEIVVLEIRDVVGHVET